MDTFRLSVEGPDVDGCNPLGSEDDVEDAILCGWSERDSLSPERLGDLEGAWRGNVTTVLSNNYGPDHKLVHRQLLAQSRALPIAISLIVQKLRNSITTLQTLPATERVQTAVGKISADAKELIRTPPKSLKALRGIEGGSAFQYFSAWRQLPIKWKGLGRRPIPNDWNSVGPRTSANNIKGYNRDASHPLNAILNYAYAVLESHVRIEIISQGYDPTIGYLHAFEKYREALVFDLMEPLRPVVDLAVLGFAQSRTFERPDFTIRSDGVCRVNSDMARHVVSLLVMVLSRQDAVGPLLVKV